MAASRWNTDPTDFFRWIEEEENNIRLSFSDLILQLMSDQSQNGGTMSEPSEDSLSQGSPAISIPGNLPILPLRGLVVYPQTAVPLTIGQPRSIKLVDDVVIGEKLIGLVTAKKPRAGESRP